MKKIKRYNHIRSMVLEQPNYHLKGYETEQQQMKKINQTKLARGQKK